MVRPSLVEFIRKKVPDFDPHGFIIRPEQDQIAPVNRHLDPRAQILASRICARQLGDAFAMRLQLIEKR